MPLGDWYIDLGIQTIVQLKVFPTDAAVVVIRLRLTVYTVQFKLPFYIYVNYILHCTVITKYTNIANTLCIKGMCIKKTESQP